MKSLKARRSEAGSQGNRKQASLRVNVKGSEKRSESTRNNPRGGRGSQVGVRTQGIGRDLEQREEGQMESEREREFIQMLTKK